MQQSTNNLHYLTNETVANSKEVSGAMDDVSGGASTLANSVDEVSERTREYGAVSGTNE